MSLEEEYRGTHRYELKEGDIVSVGAEVQWTVEDARNGVLTVKFHRNGVAYGYRGYFYYSSTLIQHIIQYPQGNGYDPHEVYFPKPKWEIHDFAVTSRGLKYHVFDTPEVNQDKNKTFWINILLKTKELDIHKKFGLYAQIPAYLHPINMGVDLNPFEKIITELEKDASPFGLKKIFQFNEEGNKSQLSGVMARLLFSRLWRIPEEGSTRTEIYVPNNMSGMVMKGLAELRTDRNNSSLLFEKAAPYYIRLRVTSPELSLVNQRLFEDAFLLSDERKDAIVDANLDVLKNTAYGEIIAIQEDYAWIRDYSDAKSSIISYLLPLSVLEPLT